MKFDICDCISELSKIPCPLIWGDLNYVMNPIFSVTIPTYKRPELLKNCIMSAVNQIGFTESYEIIVVDNEETDTENDTERLIKQLNIPNLLYYRNKVNIQAAGNWNRCVMLARSKWVVMCHDDDWLKDNCLRTLKDIINDHVGDKLELGYIRPSGRSWYDPKLNTKPKKKKWKPHKKDTALIKRSYSDVIWSGGATWAGAPTCGALINKKAFIEVGGYNQQLSPCPDCYVPYHMLGRYGVYKTYYSLGYYRWSENDTYKKSTLLNLIEAYNEFLEILSEDHRIVQFFSNEHYADCVHYYVSKGKEAGVTISDAEIRQIRGCDYSYIKLKILYICRRVLNFKNVLLAH